MKKSRHSDEQIFRILREADRNAMTKRNSVSENSIDAWRKRFGETGSDDVKRLRSLEAKNTRRKKMVAERDLKIENMREIGEKK